MVANRDVRDQLMRVGLTKNEASIYLDCYQHGISSVQQVAQRLSLNRITVHSAVEQLLEKGFISETREGRRRRILCEPPDVLYQSIAEREQKLRQTKIEVDHFVSLLSSIPKLSTGSPEVRFYRGVDGLKRLLEETLEAEDLVRVYIDIEQFVSLLTADYLVDYYRRRASRRIRSRLIWPDCPFAREIMGRQDPYLMDIRLNKNFEQARVGTFSWNNKMGIKTLSQDNLTCTIIESKEFADFYQNVLFDPLWESMPKKNKQKTPSSKR